MPKTKPPVLVRHCRCGARIARDNRELLCSPCQVRESEDLYQLEQERIARASARTRELYEGRVRVRLEDVPLPGEWDREPPEIVRMAVFNYARTGEYRYAADATGITESTLRRILRREAARSIIELMVEEGTWPAGT